MKIFAVSPERFLFFDAEHNLVDQEGNSFLIQRQTGDHEFVADNLETFIVQDLAFSLGGDALQDYEDTLSDCLYRNCINFDFFHFFDILPMLRPHLFIRRKCKVGNPADLAIYNLIEQRFINLGFSFDFEDLQTFQLEWINKRLDELTDETALSVCLVDSWLALDYRRCLAEVLDILCPL